MKKILLSLLLLSFYGSTLFAQEPLEIEDVERVPLGNYTYQWRNISDRTPLNGKCRIILSYSSYLIANFNKDGVLDGAYEEYKDNYLSKKITYVKGRPKGKDMNTSMTEAWQKNASGTNKANWTACWWNTAVKEGLNGTTKTVKRTDSNEYSTTTEN